MDLYAFHLQARSAFHFGERGIGLEASADYMPSDTLFGALCYGIQQHYGYGLEGLQALLERFKQQPPFLLSGAYPYVGAGGYPIRFYPAPLHFRTMSACGSRSGKQSIGRKVRWVSETVFRTALQGANASIFAEPNTYLAQINALVTAEEAQRLLDHYADPLERTRALPWVVGDVPRVAVDRVTNASSIYRAGRLRFAADSGLWVSVHFPKASAWSVNDMLDVLRQLGDTGIGGERSGGYGQFEVQKPERIQFGDQGSHFITLSHYSPTCKEQSGILHDDARYEIVIRRGWINHVGERHRTVRMLRAGSVLAAHPQQSLYGRIIDVTPEHSRHFDAENRIWRYGYALPVYITGYPGENTND